MDWDKIKQEFIDWDAAGKFNASQKDILNWFEIKFNETIITLCKNCHKKRHAK